MRRAIDGLPLLPRPLQHRRVERRPQRLEAARAAAKLIAVGEVLEVDEDFLERGFGGLDDDFTLA